MAHRDRVERAGGLAVAAEDALGEVDLVDGRVALAGRDAVLGRVLGRHHADAVGRAGGRAQRAADALLEPACPRSGAACGGRESAGTPAPSPPGTAPWWCPRRSARRSSSARARSRGTRARSHAWRPAGGSARPRSRPRRDATRRAARARRRTSPAAARSRGSSARRPSVGRHHDDRRHECVERGQRQQHLPAEAHQLVVAQARKRGPGPDEQERDDRHLGQHHERVHPPRRMDPERQQPAAEEDRRDHARHHQHVQVLGEVVGGEAPAAVLGVVAADQLGVGLGQVKGRAVGLGEAGDQEDQEADELGDEEPHPGLGVARSGSATASAR